MCNEKLNEWIKYTQGILSDIRGVTRDFERFGYDAFVNVSAMKTVFEIDARLQNHLSYMYLMNLPASVTNVTIVFPIFPTCAPPSGPNIST